MKKKLLHCNYTKRLDEQSRGETHFMDPSWITILSAKLTTKLVSC